MTDTANAKTSIVEEFKGLTTKQWIAIIGAFAAGIVLLVTGLYASLCLGFFLIAILLYMLPHIAGVTSPKIKAVIGVLFCVTILIVGTFAYSDAAADRESHPSTNIVLTDVEMDGDTLIITSTNSDLTVSTAIINEIGFGIPSSLDRNSIKSDYKITYLDGKYYSTISLESGKYYYIEVAADTSGGEKQSFEYWSFHKNTGVSSSDVTNMNFMGALILTGEIALIFFVMLIFSELMRRSAQKTRAKMEKDGRLYPQGYNRCKECGTMVLPGETVCRKCGAAVEVPEEVKVLHKKDFFQCSECGTEVPMDAKVCPKCGASFDGEETEIQHADGTVDVSNETFECSECGKVVPANAKRCPYCGAEFDEDDE